MKCSRLITGQKPIRLLELQLQKGTEKNWRENHGYIIVNKRLINSDTLAT